MCVHVLMWIFNFSMSTWKQKVFPIVGTMLYMWPLGQVC